MESDGSVAAKYPSANDIVMAIQFKACALNFSLSIFSTFTPSEDAEDPSLQRWKPLELALVI
uniref:Uncharacterized protein n=1 Tax=Hyaloperonospora arabidopsidis (strain Emoy2) TaxID=559515 RepID=M4B3F1_HYAAE